MMRNLFTQTIVKNCQTTLSKIVKLTFSSANSLQRVYCNENQEPGKFMGFLANFITCLKMKAGNFRCHLLNNSFDYTKKTARK